VNKDLIQKLNESPTKVFIAATGGGSSFIGEYLKVSGGSKTILGFYVPYAQPLFDEFIGGKPDKYVSSVAARKLAVASYDKARKLGGNLGMGVSCSLTTGAGEREGRENWVHIAVHGANFTSIYDTRIDGTFSTREAQELFVARIMLEILAYESGFFPEFGKWEGKCYERHECKNATVCGLISNDEPTLVIDGPDEMSGKSIPDDLVVFGGSFNPYHAGHEEMAKIAGEITGSQVVLELCVKNVDKAGLDYIDILTRVKPLKDKYPVVITNTPLIIDKMRLLRKEFGQKSLTFVMGKDTWDRFLNPKYDSNIPALVSELGWNNVYGGIKFLVFGRNSSEFNPNHPAEQWRIKDSRAENFDVKVSSSAIRAGQVAKV
jgi:nicotinic acid mononucleotide adenylyltransferase